MNGHWLPALSAGNFLLNIFCFRNIWKVDQRDIPIFSGICPPKSPCFYMGYPFGDIDRDIPYISISLSTSLSISLVWDIPYMVSYNQCTGYPLYATRISHTLLLWTDILWDILLVCGPSGISLTYVWYIPANILYAISMRISHTCFCFQGCESGLTRVHISHAISTTVKLRHHIGYSMFVQGIS